MTTQPASSANRSLAASLWMWLVAYPVTRSLWFIAAVIAGACAIAAEVILGVMIASVVAGLAIIVALGLLAAVVLIAVAPIIITPTKLTELTSKAGKAVKSATTETPANTEA